MLYTFNKRELADLDIEEYRRTTRKLTEYLRQEIAAYCKTSCSMCGNEEAQAKYFLWIKTLEYENSERSLSNEFCC